METILLYTIMKNKGYKFFTKGKYNINIIGIRKDNIHTNSFDDELHLIYRDELSIVHKIYKVTTDPGFFYLENPMRVSGTAILCPGQYSGAYKIAKHRGKYDALCQRGIVKIYRDSNKDLVLDKDAETIHEGYFGINIHRSNSSRESTNVDKWSAGCQVFSDPKSFSDFMDIVKKSSEIYGNSFTYTLLKEEDLRL